MPSHDLAILTRKWHDLLPYKRLYTVSANTQKFYYLPKIHKATCPRHPVLAWMGSVAYSVANCTAEIAHSPVERLTVTLKTLWIYT